MGGYAEGFRWFGCYQLLYIAKIIRSPTQQANATLGRKEYPKWLWENNMTNSHCTKESKFRFIKLLENHWETSGACLENTLPRSVGSCNGTDLPSSDTRFIFPRKPRLRPKSESRQQHKGFVWKIRRSAGSDGLKVYQTGRFWLYQTVWNHIKSSEMSRKNTELVWSTSHGCGLEF